MQHTVIVLQQGDALLHPAVRRATRPDNLHTTPWLSAAFLAGGGVTALGISLAGQASQGLPVASSSGSSGSSGSNGNVTCSTNSPAGDSAASQLCLQQVLQRGSWPWWRPASAHGPSESGLLPPTLAAHTGDALPGPSRPPPLPEKEPPDPAAAGRAVAAGGGGTSGVVGAQAAVPLTRAFISDAAAKVAPSVVHLVVTDGPSTPTPAGNGSGPHAPNGAGVAPKSSGSGVVYDSRGYILTAAHVVAAAADGSPLLVTTQDGRTLRARVLAFDKVSDVAVVKVDAGEPLPAASFGASTDLLAGSWVVALGSPLMLRHSVTAGVVSCVERRGNEMGLSGMRTGFIQSDVAINQGNSGGPLVDLDGHVVGINHMKAVAADGVSFAIPTESLRQVVRQFSTHGRAVRPFVGISMLEVSNGGLRQLRERVPRLPLASMHALVITRVLDGSPAAECGLQSEDVLLSLDGAQGLPLQAAIDRLTDAVGVGVDVTVLRRDAGGVYQPLTMRLTPVEAHQ